jgi:hypothetical protein
MEDERNIKVRSEEERAEMSIEPYETAPSDGLHCASPGGAVDFAEMFVKA